MSSPAYRPELDGLRAVAVYLVVAFHAQVALLDGGFVGVDLFFVLSGFLVTGMLLRDVDTRGRVRLGHFYARRVRRLLPAAVVVLVATAALQVLVASLPDRVAVVDDARASILYYANWHFVAEGRDYFAADGVTQSPFLHFWSLSIEEQFYIGYPLVLLLLVRFARRPVRALAGVLGAVVLVSVGLQVWTAQHDVNLAYYGTHTRVYQLAAGALLMLAVRRTAQAPPAGRRWATPAAVVGLAGVVVVGSSLVGASQSTRGLLATAGSVLVLLGLWWAPRGPVARVLALPLPRYLGQVSYGTYLWHWPVVLVLDRVLAVRSAVLAVLVAVLATGLAALSHQVLEAPVREARWLHRFRWRTVGVALATSGLVFAFLLPAVLEADRRPALDVAGPPSPVGRIAARLDRPVPADLDLVAADRDRGSGELSCTAADPDGCLVVPGDGPHVLLLGDSIARTLSDAFVRMARDHDLRLSVTITPNCPWQVDQVLDALTDDREANCRAHRRDFYEDVLPTLDVDVVVVAGLPRFQPDWEDRLHSPSSPPGETLAELQRRTTEETADLVGRAGPALVVVKSIIGTDGFAVRGFDPLDCLATADRLADCAVYPPLERPGVDTAFDVLESERDGVATLDLNPLVCPNQPLCSPVVDGQVVWRDDHHVTATYYRQRSEAIHDLLLGTGLLTPSGSTASG